MSKNIYKSLLQKPLGRQWKRIGIKKRAGIIAPLFSIWSQKSLGIGEIPDLKLLVDWCQKTGNKILELLPLNDTGFNFRPYDSQSSFALDPVYLSLRSLIGIRKEGLEKELKILAKKFILNKKWVNYGIKKAKIEKLWPIFLKRANLSLQKFKNFIKNNRYWLDGYCLFRILKEYHQEKSWEAWQKPFKNRKCKALKEFKKTYQKKIKFQQWLQWQLFEQFKEVKLYAKKQGIFLKGDLPLLVSRDSADVWANRQYFKINLTSGAPPDFFASKGQRWGMPPYNWKKISGDHFIYLIQRLKYAENFYDLFRIDHIVGIFRIWTIPISKPLENQGLKGVFDPKDQKLWEERGCQILKVMVKNTKMLLCAENLGTIPPCCPKVLKEIGIPCLRVQRWNKNWSTWYFKNPKGYQPLSVATLSTHDISNFSAWWEIEAGTVDEEIFKRKCSKNRVDFRKIKEKLFCLKKPARGRLRWKSSIENERILIKVLRKPEREVSDLIMIYRESYKEKEKLWKMIFKKGSPPIKANKKLIKKNLEVINRSASIFTALLLLEWLFLGDILKGMPSQYRFNRAGTISNTNWSLRIPISLENLLNHSINSQIKEIISKTGRA